MRIVVMALTMALLGGCATANETFGMGQLCGRHPYCGAATDIEIIKASTNDNDVYSRALAPFAIVDLPFSIVADTLILPYTIFHMRPAEE
ncbi:YceK/YidQ family lipoprotein [Pseudomonas kilonensis]